MNAALRPEDADGFGINGLLPALGCHALLVWALAVGVNWRSSDDGAVAEAELWAAVPQAAAPRAEEAPTPPPPQPVLAPRPDPRVAAEQARQEREAEIAEQREKRRREELKRKATEEAEREEKARKARELKAKQDQKDKAEAERRRDDKAAKAEEARREAQRQENLRRMQGLAGASGGPGATGSALQSAGPSAGYAGRIKARIKPNITLTDLPADNPLAEVEVRTLPDGQILSTKLVKASGNKQWDDAVVRAVEKTGSLPRDIDGRVPPVLVIAFRPNE